METLIEIAMLCEETSISDFVDNLEDLRKILYSMTPAVVAFLNDGFTKTRFTKKVTNLDWKVGDIIKVYGKSSFDVTQYEANTKWSKGKAHEHDDISNR